MVEPSLCYLGWRKFLRDWLCFPPGAILAKPIRVCWPSCTAIGPWGHLSKPIYFLFVVDVYTTDVLVDVVVEKSHYAPQLVRLSFLLEDDALPWLHYQLPWFFCLWQEINLHKDIRTDDANEVDSKKTLFTLAWTDIYTSGLFVHVVGLSGAFQPFYNSIKMSFDIKIVFLRIPGVSCDCLSRCVRCHIGHIGLELNILQI